MFKRLSLKSEFSRNTAILIIGTIIAQSIPILLQPVLRRVYTPEDFGAMAVYFTILSMISIVACFRYEAAIVLPKNDSAAANVLSLSLLINFVFSGLLLLLLLLFNRSFAELIGFPENSRHFLLF